MSSGAVTTVTITDEGTSYNVGDTCSADNINLGNNTGPAGSGFTFTITNTRREVFVKGNAAHQVVMLVYCKRTTYWHRLYCREI